MEMKQRHYQRAQKLKQEIKTKLLAEEKRKIQSDKKMKYDWCRYCGSQFNRTEQRFKQEGFCSNHCRIKFEKIKIV